ncbi:asparagine synthase (glutamine-hydrolyzing) [Leptothrix ochracea]|uniref:asparagine synthase (glutamine-hydrolyzing) n=1 Tax=Leptothrix ochracea TaxID=735331 RepID=UPI0034E245DB
MCGLTGFLSLGDIGPRLDAEALLRRMAGALRHRGPDSAGVWSDREAGIGLGHRRLAIVDVSEAGHQPMTSVSGRYVIAFNGEIYNHTQLRAELAQLGRSPAWRGHSDTETLLAGFEAWGFEATLKRAVGMFAIALWDRQERTLSLARDRMGEKPLYWGWQGGVGGHARTLLFGSELKALRAHPAFAAVVDRDALALLLRHNYIGAPHAIYQGIHKLEPGCWLQVSQAQPEPQIHAYWSALEVALKGHAEPFVGSENDAVDRLEALLKDAVGQQMMADVPLGAFLSGGIDSSAVVALMQAQSSRPVKTFTIGFHEPGYNEAEHAKAVAQHLGTEHTELYIEPAQALAVIPDLPKLYDEPFSDSSQIPTFLVSQLARQHVTVSLSGDGGDELFCGYERYRLAHKLWHRISKVPRPLRHLACSALQLLSPDQWNRLIDVVESALPAKRRHPILGDKIYKGAGLLGSAHFSDLYWGLISHWPDPAKVVLGSSEPTTILSECSASLMPGLSEVERMMVLDQLSYLPGDILTKVDRAAMGVSLESRVPMLDHRVVEFAACLPQGLKLHDGVTKWPLRQVLYRHVPQALIDRPKMGFAIPLKGWLRAPLKDWAEALLDPARLAREGYFDVAAVRRKWDDHVHGRRDWQAHVWDVLMFQAWLDEQARKDHLP